MASHSCWRGDRAGPLTFSVRPFLMGSKLFVGSEGDLGEAAARYSKNGKDLKLMDPSNLRHLPQVGRLVEREDARSLAASYSRNRVIEALRGAMLRGRKVTVRRDRNVR